jgi:glyceraldehyde-3-phosphate dehydrogenase (NADP+)
MIDDENSERVIKWVNESVNEGAKLLYGGVMQNNVVMPTILTNTKLHQKVNCEEVFGPVVTIEPYDNFEEAVQVLNHGRFGLQAGIFSNLMSEINYAFNTLEVGGLVVNDVPTFRVDHMPYGGVKESGLGREGVKYAMMDMLEPKLLVKDIW